jgi:hypothetical protein
MNSAKMAQVCFRSPRTSKPGALIPAWRATRHALLYRRFSLAQARNAVALFPLPALLEQFHAFKAFHNIPFAAQSGRRPQTPML